ncbi:PaaI family thioesterase [Parendozoicomonas sp. Alg238-R29]|uniref:PaaI family thioesterase n=1 Tax=Parendozoicomonas sp. Alg238-R29 TaxID=2993446 RepID=UPI00248E1C3F|nr:PaaI family thioesterase [Parendozoicomonas sp. Alg238-R29]
MSLENAVKQARETGQLDQLIDNIPYAKLIGVKGQLVGDEALFLLPPQDANIGNPVLPAIHGGVIGGFMETAAALHLLLFMNQPKIPAIIDFSIDYLRSGQLRDTFAECQLHRQGRRVANVSVTAWQSHRDVPIATGRVHFRL